MDRMSEFQEVLKKMADEIWAVWIDPPKKKRLRENSRVEQAKTPELPSRLPGLKEHDEEPPGKAPME